VARVVAVGHRCRHAAVAVGGVVPQLVDGSRTPYVLLGAGYAVLSAAAMIGGLTLVGAVLAIGTLAVILFEA
jgi:hypothetical protein